ncbi:MAG: epoxyqueuosine reductase QueH [Treponema sp.]|nr:epoxyqueuosine reductase QueH [Treponema sp.]
MKLLLHCCCAPCSISSVIALRGNGIEPHLFWYNQNIHPINEYESRRDCFLNFAKEEKLETSVIDEYSMEYFTEAVCGKPESRCFLCYRIRLEKTAAFAKENNFGAFTTTLLISPYQDHDAIVQISRECSAKYGVGFYYMDFRRFFKESQASARARGFYMQKYCGCTNSYEEKK